MPVKQAQDDCFPAPGPGQIPALMAWMWGGAFRWNTDVFGPIASEWCGFVGDRIQENCELAGRLAYCRAPGQFWVAYSDFWKKAVEDCRQEQMLIMRRLTNGATGPSGRRLGVVTTSC
jgi:hypothetical protein